MCSPCALVLSIIAVAAEIGVGAYCYLVCIGQTSCSICETYIDKIANKI